MHRLPTTGWATRPSGHMQHYYYYYYEQNLEEEANQTRCSVHLPFDFYVSAVGIILIVCVLSHHNLTALFYFSNW